MFGRLISLSFSVSDLSFTHAHISHVLSLSLSLSPPPPSPPSLSLSHTPIAVYFFLSGELSREKLSHDNELKRAKYAQTLEGLLNKIQMHQPAHLNNTNGISSKPPPPIPPASSDTPPKPSEPDHEPTDYLAFEPSPLDGSEPQELYEAMENAQDEQDELYEETREFCLFRECVLGKGSVVVSLCYASVACYQSTPL